MNKFNGIMELVRDMEAFGSDLISLPSRGMRWSWESNKYAPLPWIGGGCCGDIQDRSPPTPSPQPPAARKAITASIEFNKFLISAVAGMAGWRASPMAGVAAGITTYLFAHAAHIYIFGEGKEPVMPNMRLRKSIRAMNREISMIRPLGLK